MGVVASGRLATSRRIATRCVDDVAANLAFFTRLPMPARANAKPDWPRMAWAAPLAGAIVGAIGALTAEIARALDLPPMIGATLAIAAIAMATGALHEDGLADVADGFGGGATREAKLAIMRDSRIGAYGALALVLALLLRVGAIMALQRTGPGFAACALVLAGSAARCGALAPLAWLPPARADGAGASASGFDGAHFIAAALTLAAIAGLAGLIALEVTRALFASVLAGAAAFGMCALARRQVGGQTGDIAGASAQICEIVTLLALLIGGRPG